MEVLLGGIGIGFVVFAFWAGIALLAYVECRGGE